MSQTKAQLLDPVDLSIVTADLADDAVTAAKLASNAVVNASVDASAAIAGTKISPNFGSQNTTTTGIGAFGELQVTSTAPKITFFDSDTNPDFEIRNLNGVLHFKDVSSTAVRMQINTDGHVDVLGNLDVGAGLDVTGAITGTGDLTIDTNTLHVDSSNNRVGIGTTSPSEELTITSATPAIKLEDTDLANSYIQLSAGDGDMFFSANDTAHNGQFFFRSGLNGTFTERARIDSGGNLGLGASITTARLDVARLGNSWTGQSPVSGTVAHFHNGNNGSTSPAYLGLGAGTASISGINFGDADDADVGRILYSHSDNSLRFNTNTGERLRINSAGDISIGLTSGTRTPVHIHEPSTATTNIHMTNTTSGTGSQDGLTIFMDGTASAGFWYRENGPLRFATNNTERMRITNIGQLQIGDTTAADTSEMLLVDGAGGSDHTGIGVKTSNNVHDGYIAFHDSDATFRGQVRYDHSVDAMFFNTAATERMRIRSDGNVGIGVSSTDFKLDVNGPIRVGQSVDGIIIENSTANPSVANACRIHRNGSTGELNITSGTTTARNMIFRTLTAAAESMRLTSGGRLGIGLTAPHRTIHQHVSGSGSNYHQFTNATTGSGATDGGLVGLDSAENLLLWNLENNAVKFGSNNTERARITNDGKFLMGNTGSLDMGFGPQVLSIRGGNSAGYDGTAAAIFGQQDNDAATCIFYNSATNNGTNMLDTRCARGGHSGYSFAIYRSNSAGDTEFRLRGDGNAYADGSWNGGGADYAEYFEWTDGNSSDEDRRGYTVVLDGNKIRKSTSSDSAATIIGVISGNPSIVGDNDIDNWKQKYQKDDYGSYVLDSNGERILNSDWDETKEYVSREDRKEWSIVGLMGKIRIRKGQTMGTNWIKMQDISATVEEWLVR